MVVSKSFVEVFESPCLDSQKVDEILFGEEVEILKEEADFFKIKTEYSYCGFILKDGICRADYNPNFIVSVPFADLLFEPKYRLRPSMTLPIGARIKGEDYNERYAKATLVDGSACYIRREHIKPLPCESLDENETRKGIVKTAKSFLGTQYRWGGRTAFGVDCSGLCFNAYQYNGIDIWRDAVFEKSKNLRRITLAEAKEGDLVFFKGHIAIYLGDGEIIHSSASRGAVVTENLFYNEKLKEIYICTGTAFDERICKQTRN